MRFSNFFFFVLSVCVLASCAEDTAWVGSGAMPEVDHASTSQELFYVCSRTVESGAVLEGTNLCYLGNVIDADDGSETTASFMAQYHIMENTLFPEKGSLDLVDGKPVADSCFVTLYFSDYFGDPNAPMRLVVEPLSKEKVMEEGVKYYTDIDISDYVDADSPFKKTTTFSVQQAINARKSSSSYNQINIRLSDELATYVFAKYYENPEWFRNSRNIIRNVFPGLAFRTEESVGCMLNVEFSTFDLHFHYYETAADGSRTKVDGMQRMAATEEVLQNSCIVNDIPSEMTDEANEFTYVKSPAALFTEVTLPIEEIAFGAHYRDTINMASLSFGRIKEEASGSYSMAPATHVMLIQKDELKGFFDAGRVADGRASYIAEFSASDNAYSFSNLSRLISDIRTSRDAEAGVKEGDSDSERAAKYAAWDAANPNWNKFLLVPVATEYAKLSASSSLQVLQRVRNLLSLSSVKLAGGPSGNLNMTVVYSKFE